MRKNEERFIPSDDRTVRDWVLDNMSIDHEYTVEEAVRALRSLADSLLDASQENILEPEERANMVQELVDYSYGGWYDLEPRDIGDILRNGHGGYNEMTDDELIREYNYIKEDEENE